MLRKSSKMATNVGATFPFMLAPLFPQEIRGSLEEKAPGNLFEMTVWSDTRTTLFWVFAEDSCSLLYGNDKQEGRSVGRCNMVQWLGSEASLRTCWEIFHHQRSSDDSLQGQRGGSRLLCTHPKENLLSSTQQSPNDILPILCHMDCVPD